MFISKVCIEGFKSFVQPTELHLVNGAPSPLPPPTPRAKAFWQNGALRLFVCILLVWPHTGFNVITGANGAGKSNVIDVRAPCWTPVSGPRFS